MRAMRTCVSRTEAFVWACEQHIPPVQKLVLLRIADAGPEAAFTMPEFAGITRSEADWIIGSLLDDGLLRRESDGVIDVDPAFKAPYEPPRGPLKRKIPASVRRAVFERDEGICQHCGSTDDPTIDHVYPEIAGGTDDPHNLQILCRSCNSRKGAAIPSDPTPETAVA